MPSTTLQSSLRLTYIIYYDTRRIIWRIFTGDNSSELSVMKVFPVHVIFAEPFILKSGPDLVFTKIWIPGLTNILSADHGMEFIQENKIRTRKLNLKDYNFEEIKLSFVFKLLPYLTWGGARVQEPSPKKAVSDVL